MSRFLPRALLAPAVITLFLWMIVPLLMTIYFSVIRYNLMQPGETGFIGLANYEYFVTDPSFGPAILNTLILLGSVIAITVVGGVSLALLIDDPFPGRALVRVLLISPFFVMPTVNALLWKHMMMNPIYGVFAQVATFLRSAAGRLADRLAAVLGDRHGGMAVAAVCHSHLCNGVAIDESRATGSCAHGWRHLPAATAPPLRPASGHDP